MHKRSAKMRTFVPSRHKAAIVAAVAAAALAAAPSALAATPLTGESLSGGGSASFLTCSVFYYGSGTFSVSGTATGPYPGSFTETGSFSFRRWDFHFPLYWWTLAAKFTIKSGSNTITGSLSNARPGGFMGGGCPSLVVMGGGPSGPNMAVNYTTTVVGDVCPGTGTVTVRAGTEVPGATVLEDFG